MRPVLLTIDGFASYRHESTVDFREADFFVLVGATGSGKSTVIDAMVFALYGTVPRWDDRAAVAPALAPSANRALVRLIFDVGGKRYSAVRDVRRGGGKTQAVTVKEARLEQFVSPDATGADDEETIVIDAGSPKVTKAVEALLGLSFEQFTQSVALPQGEFARFLHATDGDRQQILKDLLGYGIYDRIGQAANTRAKDNTLRAETLSEQLVTYLDATPQRVSELDATVGELKTFQHEVTTVSVPALTGAAGEAAAVRARVEVLSAERTELLAVVVPPGLDELHTEQQTKTTAVTLAAADESRLEGEDNSARAALKTLAPRHELEAAQQHWKELERIDSGLPGLADAATARASGLVDATRERDDAEVALAALRATSTCADRAAEQHQHDVDAARHAHATVAAVAQPAGLDVISQAIDDANAQLVQANTALTDAETAQQSAVDELAAAPDAAALAAGVTDANELTTLLAKDSANAAQRSEHTALATHAQTEAAVAASALADAEVGLHAAERADAAAVIRSELHVGDDCPVCHHAITELSPSGIGGDVDAARTALRDATARADTAAATATQLENKCSTAAALHAENLGACDRLRSRLVDELSTVQMADRGSPLDVPFTPDTPADALNELADTVAQIHTELVSAQRERSTLEQRRQAADQAVTAARAAAHAAQLAAAAAQDHAVSARTALRDARDTVSALTPPVIDDTDIRAGWHQLTDWCQATGSALADRLVTMTARAQDASATATRLRTDLNHAQATATAAIDQLRVAALAQQEADTRLQTARQRHGELTGLLVGQPGVDDVNSQLQQVIALQQAVDAAGLALTDARATTLAARQALAGVESAIDTSRQQLLRTRDPLTRFGAPEITGTDLAAGWQALANWSSAEAESRFAATQAAEGQAAEADSRAATAQRALTDALTSRDIPVPDGLAGNALGTQALPLVAAAVATAAAALTHARQRLRECEDMQAKMASAAEEAEVAKSLANLMHSTRFPRWLISSALDTLLDDASDILMELSGGQFELSRDERDLLVIDHNDADMSRLVKTLSGGETFQASLALALALSRQVAAMSVAGASKLESIFLDEGFGTLDEATLDVVASTLENLASSGSRMVGVITHVAALAERIPVRYKVVRDGTGSHIERQAL